ncbi:MAG: GIY-YIG nuclease family protein [Verrucomicrobia bacterium]|nr:GIY-YIG nuclease family protein [Verrucomicrobiota bacterium]
MKPGVYLMKDEADQVLYVGKAKNLRKRLANYRVAFSADSTSRRPLRLRSVEVPSQSKSVQATQRSEVRWIDLPCRRRIG